MKLTYAGQALFFNAERFQNLASLNVVQGYHMAGMPCAEFDAQPRSGSYKRAVMVPHHICTMQKV